MANDADHAAHANESLARWLVGGLVVGCIVLGLLIGAYALGYHRGSEKETATAPVAGPATTTTTAAATTTTAATTTGAAAGPVKSTPALVAQGKQLFASDGCVGCHSLTGGSGAGPALNGLAGSTVELSDGTSVTADDAYLRRAITDPDAEIVSGYKPGIMSAAVSSFDLGSKSQDVDALVAYIKSVS